MNKIKIPVRYKEELLKRFDDKSAILKGCPVQIDNRVENRQIYEILIKCALCAEYVEKQRQEICRGCPFHQQVLIDEGRVTSGVCERWLKKWGLFQVPIQGTDSQRIWWYASDDKEAREQLRKFKEEAAKGIEWVE